MSQSRPSWWWWIPLTVALSAGAGGCASEEGGRVDFPTDGELVELAVHGDGFVVWKDSRMPVEAFVLRLRQHLRELSKEQRGKVVVEARYAAGVDAELDEWIRDQCYLMGVGWYRVLL